MRVLFLNILLLHHSESITSLGSNNRIEKLNAFRAAYELWIKISGWDL